MGQVNISLPEFVLETTKWSGGIKFSVGNAFEVLCPTKSDDFLRNFMSSLQLSNFQLLKKLI